MSTRTPDSPDRRERMLAALAAGEASHPALAARFWGRRSCVEHLGQRGRPTPCGRQATCPHRPSHPPAPGGRAPTRCAAAGMAGCARSGGRPGRAGTACCGPLSRPTRAWWWRSGAPRGARRSSGCRPMRPTATLSRRVGRRAHPLSAVPRPGRGQRGARRSQRRSTP
jgi:hypothetical protein